MSSSESSLVKALVQCVRQKHIDASCGLMRRILCESPPAQCDVVLRSEAAKALLDLGKATLQRQKRSPQTLRAASAASASASDGIPRSASVAVLAHAALRMSRWQDALYFATWMESGQKLTSGHFTASLVTKENWRVVRAFAERRGLQWLAPSALEQLVRTGAWDSALELATAEHARGRFAVGDLSFAVAIPMLVHSRNGWVESLRLFNSAIQSGWMVQPQLVLMTLRASLLSGQWHACLRMAAALDKIHALGDLLDAPLLDDLVRICPTWQHCVEVLNCSRRSTAVAPSQALLEHVLTRCDASGAWEAAARVYEAAVREGFLENIGQSSYAMLIRSLHLASQWRQAIEAVSWMSSACEAAALTGMEEIVNLCEESGQWNVALSLGAELLVRSQTSAAVVGDHHGMVPLRASTYLALTLACAAGRQWEGAIATYNAALTHHPTTPHPLAACSVLQSCAAEGRWLEGLRFFHRLLASRPHTVIPPLAYSLAAGMCVREKRWQQALLVIQEMQCDGLPLDNHNQRLGLWAAALSGSWRQCLQHYQRIPNRLRTMEDSMVLRSSTRFAGPLASAIALRLIDSKR